MKADGKVDGKKTVQTTIDGEEIRMTKKNPTLEKARTGDLVRRQKHYIKFRRNNYGKHKGRYWSKLVKYDKDGKPEWTRELMPPALLTFVKPMWSDELTLEQIQEDTFPDWTENDWTKWIKHNYGRDKIFGLLLYFSHIDGEFTTFRPYSVRTHNYWESLLRKEVHIHAK